MLPNVRNLRLDKKENPATGADRNSVFGPRRRATRRENLLKIMDAAVPWSALSGVIARYHPKISTADRNGLGRMLRILLVSAKPLTQLA